MELVRLLCKVFCPNSGQRRKVFVRSFRVECLYRDQWLKTWPPQEAAGAAPVRWPNRLKFEVVLPEGPENILRAETALPAAMIITSRVTRGLAPSVP